MWSYKQYFRVGVTMGVVFIVAGVVIVDIVLVVVGVLLGGLSIIGGHILEVEL